MAESNTTCPICRRRIGSEAPDAVLAERMDDVPGFGQTHDIVWSRVGFAHLQCVLREEGYREAIEGPAE